MTAPSPPPAPARLSLATALDPKSPAPITRTVYWAATAAILSGAFLLVFTATRWGAGVTPDSIAYITGARSVIENGNLKGLSSHWPPFYVLMVAFSGLLHSDLLASIRWLHLTIYLASVAAIGFVTLKQTGGSRLLSLIGMLLFTTAHAILSVYIMAWSEAPFLLFILLGFHFLADYVQKPEPTRFDLYCSALLIALAFATRYAGATLVVTGAIALLLFSRSGWGKRITDCAIFVTIGSSLFGLWVLRNLAAGANATNRSLVYHPIIQAHLNDAVETLARWFQLPGVAPMYTLSIALGLLLFLAWPLVSDRHGTTGRFSDLVVIFVAVYVPFLLASISFFDAHTPLDNRILSPIFLLLIASIPTAVSRLYRPTVAGKTAYGSVLGLGMLLCLTQAFETNKVLPYYLDHGVGFASKPWLTSQTLAYLDGLPKDAMIYSNGPDPIKLLLGRESFMIPTMTSPNTRQSNADFPAEVDAMKRRLTERGGVIAYFFNITWRWYLPPPATLAPLLPSVTVYRFQDGLVILFDKATGPR